MYFSSPTSNITPALVSVAMTRSDSRDSNTSTSSFTYTTPAMQVSYSQSPPISTPYSHRSSSSSSSISMAMATPNWLPSPYRSCMIHSSSSQGYTSTSTSSYISDDDLLALDDLAMPPIEYIASPTSVPRPQQIKRELTTEEHIAMLREMQEREQGTSQKSRAQQMQQQQQRTVRFAAADQKKTRRVSGASQRRGTATSGRRV